MIFEIKKGKHRSFLKLKFPFFTINNSKKFNICLIGDHKYKFMSKSDQIKTNKIVGLSDSYYHRINSIRVGFRYYNDKFDLMAYYYNNGKHYAEVIGEIYENIEFSIEIKITKYNYIIIFNNIEYKFNRTSKWFLPRYFTYPYFGGNLPTPKDIKIKVEYID